MIENNAKPLPLKNDDDSIVDDFLSAAELHIGC